MLAKTELARPPHPADADPLAHVWPRALSAPTGDPLLGDLLTRTVATPVWELMDRGGRRWRPLIARLCFDAAGGHGDVPEAVFQVVELLHHGSLIVDDVEDDAAERRAGPAVHVAHGIPLAINAANAAYFRAMAALKGGLPDHLRLRALDMLSEELFQAHLGQALDLSLGDAMASGAVVTTAHYREMAAAKTGALVRMAARLGAIAADASPEVERALGAWATGFGLAYQVSDDTADLVEDAVRPGTCRLSYPVLLALESLRGHELDDLKACLGLPSSVERDASTAGARMLELVERSGAVEMARGDARKIAQDAVGELEAACAARSIPLRELTQNWLMARL